MWKTIRPALTLFAFFTLLTGLAYPLVVLGAASLLFPHQANGSLIERNGKVLGSALIGQTFTAPGYFQGRPSATSPSYNGAASSGSNLGPNNPALIEAVQQRVDTLKAGDGYKVAPVPVDLVTASGSGLDPHLSVAAAQYQKTRVARERGWTEEQVETHIARHTMNPPVPGFGEPVVNVLELNLAMDEQH